MNGTFCYPLSPPKSNDFKGSFMLGIIDAYLTYAFYKKVLIFKNQI